VTLWRISSHRRLDGAGGLLAPGRWHSQGFRVAYCAPNPATALVEVLVHVEIEAGDLPERLQYLEIEAPDAISTATVDLDSLGRHWGSDQMTTRRAGDEWLRGASTALLLVPSVVVPATWNVLMNPRHPEAGEIIPESGGVRKIRWALRERAGEAARESFITITASACPCFCYPHTRTESRTSAPPSGTP
jgi:RES domain-containing protein